MEKSKINKVIFAQRLKSLMESNNETVYTLAELLHLSAATISRYSTADMAPKITAIESLSRHFHVNPVWLMGYDVLKYIENSMDLIEEHSAYDTIAAHFKGKNISEEKLKRIEKFIEFTLKEEED